MWSSKSRHPKFSAHAFYADMLSYFCGLVNASVPKVAPSNVQRDPVRPTCEAEVDVFWGEFMVSPSLWSFSMRRRSASMRVRAARGRCRFFQWLRHVKHGAPADRPGFRRFHRPTPSHPHDRLSFLQAIGSWRNWKRSMPSRTSPP